MRIHKLNLLQSEPFASACYLLVGGSWQRSLIRAVIRLSRLRGLIANPHVRVGILFLCGWVGFGGCLQGAQTGGAIHLSESKTRDERKLPFDEAQEYVLTVPAGHFLHLTVDQLDGDLQCQFLPDGLTEPWVVDHATCGQEHLYFLAEKETKVIFQVENGRGPEAQRYVLTVAAWREPTPADRFAALACALMNEANLNAHRNSKEADQLALRQYEQALELWKQSGEAWGEATTLGEMGGLTKKMGRRQAALGHYQAELQVWRKLEAKPQTGYALGNIGSLQEDFGEWQEALASFEAALPLVTGAGNLNELAVFYNNLAVTHSNLGEERRAIEALQEVVRLLRTTRNKKREAGALLNLAGIYADLCEYQKALDSLNQVTPLFETIENLEVRVNWLNIRGKIQTLLGDMDQALEDYSEGFNLAKKVGNPLLQAMVLNNLGKLYLERADLPKALASLQQSYSLVQGTKNPTGESAVLHNLGLVSYATGSYQEAADFFSKALALREKISDPKGQSQTNIYLGLTLVRLGRTNEARLALEKGLQNAKTYGFRTNLVEALYGLAILEREKGRLKDAAGFIAQAVGAAEAIRSGIALNELRTSYFACIHKLYEFQVDTQVRLFRETKDPAQVEAAFRTSERAHAQGLLELLTLARTDIRTDMNPALLEREQLARTRLNQRADYQSKLLSRNHTSEEAAAVAAELKRLTAEYQECQTLIQQQSPAVAALTQPSALALGEVQHNLLEPGTALIEFSLGEEKSYGWIVTQTTIEVFDLPRQKDLEPLARQVYQAISGRKQDGAVSAAGQAEALKQLSTQLLEPVTKINGIQKLVVVGDGSLLYVPLGALPLPGTNGTKRVIDHYEITNLPSATMLGLIRRNTTGRSGATKQLAIFADPVFSPDDPRLAGRPAGKTGTRSENRSLVLGKHEKSTQTLREPELAAQIPRLPGTRQEADAIASFVPATEVFKAIGFDATRETAISPQLANYRIVHFATHSFINPIHPELTGIALSMIDRKGTSIAGWVRLNDVFNLRLPADLVVLSACNSGIGKEYRGEGLIGLPRGFLHAGAARVLVTQWEVSDQATAVLMEKFYRHLLGPEKQNPAAALRAAQREMMTSAKWSAPVYWAAFQLVGEYR
ncbi:MAG: CHAT domain-containing protein [Blastocatellia bacterium]|nr:CHAT domain-containing protein [Blastocatellia bacterium]